MQYPQGTTKPMTEGEKKLMDTLQAAGYTIFQITGIIIAVTGYARQETREQVRARMGGIADMELYREFY